MIKSLKATNSTLSKAEEQLAILESNTGKQHSFQQKLAAAGLFPFTPKPLEILQVNVGKMCNQTCRHCHVDAGPDRKEIMTRATMEQCLQALDAEPLLQVVDITGGAPEMNPGFCWFVEEIKKRGRHVMVRCNLTIILANKKYHHLPGFYKAHQVEVVSSLPFYTQDRTDRQRGDGVFNSSIAALQMLNDVGYGHPGTGLILNLVYNPAGAFLPASQQSLQNDYKKALKERFNIHFNQLFAITNLPISRYLDYLLQTNNYEAYMEKLVNAFNPAAAANVMCRNTLSVGWDGYLYDCDFNQMLELKVASAHNHIANFKADALQQRHIVINQHCFGCTAGAGSSCGGAVT